MHAFVPQNDWLAPGQKYGPQNPAHPQEKSDPKGIVKPWTNSAAATEANHVEVIKRDSNFYKNPLLEVELLHAARLCRVSLSPTRLSGRV